MNCILCNKIIKNYTPTFHHLIISESREVDICSECIDKFTNWQGKIITQLFPTSTLKKRQEKTSKK